MVFAVASVLGPVVAMGETLQARIEVAQAGTNFSYTVFNDELITSRWHVSMWHLELNTPFNVIATPPGWDYITDNASYVDWYSTDAEDPYPHDIAPGASLSGFAVGAVVATSEDLAFAAMSWQQGSTNSGPSALGLVKAPSVHSFAPRLVNVRNSPEGFQFTVEGVPSLLYTVEVSTNLSEWTEVTTGTAPFTFQDASISSATARFFRVNYVDRFGGLSDSAE